MKLAWISDCHFDFVSVKVIDSFAKHLDCIDVDAAVITGDIADSKNLYYLLTRFSDSFNGKVYFTLGNHDIYDSSFSEVINNCIDFCTYSDSLIFLDASEPQKLNDNTCLTGHMGFYDGYTQSSKPSGVQLSDFKYNKDLAGHLNPRYRCKEIVDNMVPKAKSNLEKAANSFLNVLFATHVPPFIESSWYNGKLSEEPYIPYFTNTTFGTMFMETACKYSNVNFHVLCGHTHHSAEYSPLSNLAVSTAGATYGYPSVWKIFDF